MATKVFPATGLAAGVIALSAVGLVYFNVGTSDAGQPAPTQQADTRQAAAAQAAEQPAQWSWEHFITAEQLKGQLGQENLVILDVRSPEKYAQGHIPGAINLPGDDLRTPSAKPGKGDSQYIFRNEDGSPDVARYERIFSEAGIRSDSRVVVYGNHAGKGDGSIPAMLLHWLGVNDVAFLDGVGAEQWTAAGYELSTEPNSPAPSQFTAEPAEKFIWNLQDVLANLDNDQVVFYDTRSLGEFTGQDKRDNARGGHIPGAVRIDYADQIKGAGKTLTDKARIVEQLKAEGITPDKTVVLYCQTATRVSLPYLILKDLGYPNVAIYDASWHEYGNRQDTPIATGEKVATHQ